LSFTTFFIQASLPNCHSQYSFRHLVIQDLLARLPPLRPVPFHKLRGTCLCSVCYGQNVALRSMRHRNTHINYNVYVRMYIIRRFILFPQH